MGRLGTGIRNWRILLMEIENGKWRMENPMDNNQYSIRNIQYSPQESFGQVDAFIKFFDN